MRIVIVNLIFALTVFPNSVELSSPIRTREQTYIPPGEASTSGRSFSPERVVPKKVVKDEAVKVEPLHEPSAPPTGQSVQLNSAGLFYEENGVFKSVHPGIRLVTNFGFVIGRDHNGIVLPVYNNHHQMVTASEKYHTLQSLLPEEHARQMGVWKEVPKQLTPPQARNVGNKHRQNRRDRN